MEGRYESDHNPTQDNFPLLVFFFLIVSPSDLFEKYKELPGT